MFIVLAALLLTPGDHTVAFRHGGLQRSYIVHVPAPTGKPLPAVINMHGGGGNAAGQQKYTHMDRLADRDLAAEASDLVAAIAPVAGSMVLVRFRLPSEARDQRSHRVQRA